MKYQAYLGRRSEPLQIPVPGRRAELHLTTQPRWLDAEEVAAAQAYINDLSYPQTLVLTGAVIGDADDPLLNFSHDELDMLESELGLPNTRKPKAGGTRMLPERVYLIRERGYTNGGHEVRKAIAAGA